MDLIIKENNLAVWGKHKFKCAIGRSGCVAERAKIEGDGATPIGRWTMREVFYRPDREKPPLTLLPTLPLKKNDGWCDAPDDPKYNSLVTLPYKASAEQMWREDSLYDIVVVLGYNDEPVFPGKGSVLFLHIARPDFSPSAGCVTLSREDLLTVLQGADKESAVQVAPTPW